MLIRFVIENVFSFGERKEFNMLPRPRLRTLNSHRYSLGGFDVLKMSAIYGANGAGKSNLIKALGLLQDIVLKEEVPFRSRDVRFKFGDAQARPGQMLAVEFIQDETAFYYGVEVANGLFLTEELYFSGLGKEADRLIFERKTLPDGTVALNFPKAFEEDEKGEVIKAVLVEEFVKPNKSLLKLISNRDNKHLNGAKKAFEWFRETLQIITPESKPVALAHRIDHDPSFKKYAEEVLCSFGVGVGTLSTERKGIGEFFGEDNENEVVELAEKVEDSPMKMLGLRSRKGDELIVVKEGNEIFVKQLKLAHTGGNGSTALFDLDEESDGTVRLLDFVPAFHDVVSRNKVYVIDEIERSIHPVLVKSLVQKFSLDEHTKGQLIFSTHESNLLDQGIFRQDEIWFVEKDSTGATDLYALSDFKEHHTIDIRKGYLNGRYGSIPFLGNFQDLNWHRHAADK